MQEAAIKTFICRGEGFDPYRNLALEEYLLGLVGPDECILYLWQNKNTVVIGRNQNCWSECNVNLLNAEGGRLARRLSGGGAVYHDIGNLNFTFLARDGVYDLDRQLATVVCAAELLGITAERSGRNDIIADGRKFSGNAFYSSGGRRYHHGTLLVDTDTDKMTRYLNVNPAKLASNGVASVRSRVVNLSELAPGIGISDVSDAMERAFAETYGTVPEPLLENSLGKAPFDAAELEQLTALRSDWAWLYGRPFSFTSKYEDRFPWGGIEVRLSVESGMITGAAIYSDAMAGEFISAAAAALPGNKYAPEAVSSALEALCGGSPELFAITRDIAELVSR